MKMRVIRIFLKKKNEKLRKSHRLKEAVKEAIFKRAKDKRRETMRSLIQREKVLIPFIQNSAENSRMTRMVSPNHKNQRRIKSMI